MLIEQKEESINTWFYVVVDNQILFLINTPYVKVTRRTTFRINSNIWKNFGLYDKGDYFLDTILQPNLGCNHFKEEYKENHDKLHLPSNISWNTYRETYLKAYGHFPEVKIRERSATVEDR